MFGGRKRRTYRQKSRLGGTRKRRNRSSRRSGGGIMTPGRYV
jgi:hypothetical protein